MKRSAFVRFSLSFMLVVSMLSPAAAVALGDGKKYFKQGMKHEAAEEWDKAAENFALAVTENPKNPEYRLHLTRALFNASQMYMKIGGNYAKEKNYEAGYNAFRRAYAFDPTNELAKAEMDRMVRLQQESTGGGTPEAKTDANGNVRLVKTGYDAQKAPDVQMPQRLEKLRDVPFPGGVDLQYLVKELAKDLELNVLFDTESRLSTRKVHIELKNVTAAKALDYIFLQENLFFQKVGPRTILVANGNRRNNFQQLVLRTFYLANANPKDVKTIIQTAIPVQPGRSQTIVLEDPSTNSITIRDTEENIRLMSKLIASLDKDRAEVVMDVAIYEVTKSDLLEFGNQIGSRTQLETIGGTTNSVVGLGGNELFGTLGRAAGAIIPGAFGVGLVLPAANLVAFQNKSNTKLIASTQIHAFNNEDSSARIGQRVPVRTATFQTGNTTGGGVVSDVINYEQVGLTLKFKPIVFPNQDVQVAMEIESKDVAAGGTFENPIFSERTIKGTARVQNNKTLLLASVAQDVETRGRQGLPILGLIPILGRLFTAPTRDNRKTDIVIAITPRVIRAPAILPEDEVERPTGSLAVPTSGSLEAMIIEEEREELLAAARRLPTTAEVQLPDQQVVEAPAYVRTDATQSATTPPAEAENAGPTNTAAANLGQPDIRPIDTTIKTLDITQTSDTPVVMNTLVPKESEPASEPQGAVTEAVKPAAPTAEIQIAPNIPELKRGEKTKIRIMVTSASAFRSAVVGLKFNEKKLAVRSVQLGEVFGSALLNTPVTPFVNQNGKMYVSLSLPDGTVQNSTGVLAYVEIEALADGTPSMELEKDLLSILTADGKNFAVKF